MKPPILALLSALAVAACSSMHTAEEVRQFFEASTGNANANTATWCPWDSHPIAVQRLNPS